jgi:hypothetical protein
VIKIYSFWLDHWNKRQSLFSVPNKIFCFKTWDYKITNFQFSTNFGESFLGTFYLKYFQICSHYQRFFFLGIILHGVAFRFFLLLLFFISWATRHQDKWSYKNYYFILCFLWMDKDFLLHGAYWLLNSHAIHMAFFKLNIPLWLIMRESGCSHHTMLIIKFPRDS